MEKFTKIIFSISLKKPTFLRCFRQRFGVGFFGWLYKLRISYKCMNKKKKFDIFVNYLSDPLEFFRNFFQIKAGEQIWYGYAEL
jgi:hypothetical protein